MNGLQILFFAANLAFILTNFYGWLLKRFYVPAPLKEHYNELYPAHKLVATLCLLQLYDVLYLIRIGDPAALFYSNAVGLMLYSAFIYVMVKGYFFLEKFSPWKMLLFMHPILLCWVVLLLPVIGVIEFTQTYQIVMLCIVTLISMTYITFLIAFRNKLHRQIIKIDEREYSNESDFPVQIAKRVEWLPLALCAMLYVCFLINHPIAKMVRDLIFTTECVWFVYFTLNPHRTVRQELTKGEGEIKKSLSDKKRKEMEEKMMRMLVEDKLFLAEHFTMSELVQKMGTNKRYLNEVISLSKYETFYNLINALRVDNACRILEENRFAKLENVALESGFSSGSAFSQVFKKIKGVTPREYIDGLYA